ncbi:DUF748 domain-containing protein [Sulfurimonas sp.]|uniref:DUF748 domain-containing protein n=1 Tax=Sulfurimonas sp. TaxID=2022749 RepID=UPI0025DBE674|nr:DUF748 domain-containing protein [Sulfurimonas sp.]MDD5157902.1 DUF748 domain-containing protein [Sulfurimonas sp.]
MYKKVLTYLLLGYAIFGFVLLPLISKPLISKVMSEKTNGKISVSSISFNPFSFKITLNEITLSTLEDEKVATVKKLEVNLEPHSMLYGAVHIKNILLEKPELFVVYNKDKTFNFMKIIKKKEDDNSTTSRLIFDAVSVTNAIFNYKDLTKKEKFEISADDFNFKLAGVDTNDFNASGASASFHTTLSDGALLEFKSNIRGFKPLVVEGNLSLSGSRLFTDWKYIKDNLAVEVADGKLYFRTKFFLNLDDLNSTKLDDLYLGVDDLRIKPKDKSADIIRLKSFKVAGVTVLPLKKNLQINSILVDSLNLKVEKSATKEIDLLNYLKFKQDKKENGTQSEQNSTKALWSVNVGKISLQKIEADFMDRSIVSGVNTKLNELNLEMKNLTLLGEKPFSYNLDFALNDSLKCASSGDVIHKKLEINSYTKCSNLDVMQFLPYIDEAASKELKTYAVSLKKAYLDFDFNASIKDENSKIGAVVKNANLALRDFELKRRDRDEKIVSFERFEVNSTNLDTQTKAVTIGKVTLNGLDLFAKKDKNSIMSFVGLIEPKEQTSDPKDATAKKDDKKYNLTLKELELNSAKTTFMDESVKGTPTTTLDKMDLRAKNISSKENSWLKYDLSLRVNNAGNISSKGELKHTPLEQKGTAEFKKISLKEITPYLQDSTFLKISDGYLNLNVKTEYKQNSQKPDATVNGSLSVDEFFLHDSRDNSSVASFSKADVKSFAFKTSPNSLYIDEVALNSFYVDAVIDKNKSMNLSKLMKPKAQKKQTSKDKNETKEATKDAMAFKLAKLKVSNGSANFADYSLPINFKTSIHDLSGSVYAISNSKGEISLVDIDGEVDEYGSTKLKGSLESANPKSFMDLDFNFKNINLSSASGYSAQFAGYKIAKGKLFLDLKYKIKDSKLLSKNSVIIKKIELGDAIEDKSITKLPLGFAIALLEDSDGVIDIDMPIEGNVDAPDFKYGTVVLSVLKNLIVKAVTSPFKFLGSLMGIDGDKLKYIEFEPAREVLLPSEREKLDTLSSLLIKKPKISLTIQASFDNEKDKRALRIQKLKERVIQISKQEHATTEILEKILMTSESKSSLKAIKESVKKRVKEDAVASEYQKELFEKCLNTQAVSSDELRNMANKRAKTIWDYLVVAKRNSADRVLLKEIKEINEKDGDFVKTELKIEIK